MNIGEAGIQKFHKVMGSIWKNSNKSCVLKQLSLSRFSCNFACICLLLCAFSPCMNLWCQIFCWRIDRSVFSWSWEQKEKWEQAQLVQFTWVQTRFVIQLVNHSSSCSCLSHRFYRKATERTLGTKVLCTSSYNWFKKPCFFCDDIDPAWGWCWWWWCSLNQVCSYGAGSWYGGHLLLRCYGWS